MSSRWRCVFDTVLMRRCVQGGTLYMYDEFGVDRTMCKDFMPHGEESKLSAQPRPTGRSHKKDFDNWRYVLADSISGVIIKIMGVISERMKQVTSCCQ